MTEALSGRAVADRIRAVFSDAVVAEDEGSVTVTAADIVPVAAFLRDDDELDCKYLNSLTALDWLDHFDVVYHLSSLAKNHILCLKARVSHDEASLPSVLEVWHSAGDHSNTHIAPDTMLYRVQFRFLDGPAN